MLFHHKQHLLFTLEVVQQHTSLLRLLTPISYNNARAVNHLSRISLTVQHTQASPFAQHLSVRHLDKRDLVLRAQGNDEFLVGLFLAGFIKNAHVGLAAIEGFAGFTQATGETVMNECDLEDS